MSGVTEMLIPAASQPSPHCLSGLFPKPKIVLVPIKAFHFQHCRGLFRPLLLNCNKKAKPRIEWRWGNHILRRGRKIEGMNSQTRCIMAAVALSPIESDATFSTINAADCGGAALSASNITGNDSRWVGMSAPSSLSSSGSFNVAYTLSPPEEGSLPSSLRKHDLELLMGTVQNRASRTIAKTVGVSIEMGMLATEEAEKQRREEIEMLRRKKISEANKGRAPWNKGKKGVSKALDGGSATRLKDNELISPEEREHLRRQRISNANRGKIPWNKGKQHSQETKQRIRVRVIEAMKDPKIREKLRVQAEVVKLSPEIRLRIKTGIINAWNEKKRIKARQEICIVEWKEMIAEAARKGYEGDVVYQWDSHATIKEQLRSAWQPLPRKRREVVSRGDLSTEHRMRISEAIKTKWADPNYRISVEKGIHDSLVKRGLASNATSKKSNAIRPPKRKKPPIKVKTHDDAGIQKNPVTLVKEQPVFPKPTVELPAYKDPQSEKKLEKLKWMRDRRLSAEEQKRREITERARVLIAQAEKAAKALEAAAVKDKNALAPLLETRRLLAEAVRSFETTSLGRHLSKDAALWGGNGDLVSMDVLNTAAALSSPSGKGDGGS